MAAAPPGRSRFDDANAYVVKHAPPGKLAYMNCSPACPAARAMLRAGAPAFAIALGCSYFQRLCVSSPEEASLHGFVTDGQVRFGAYSHTNDDACHRAIYATCVGIACKLVCGRDEYVPRHTKLLRALLGVHVAPRTAASFELECLQYLGWHLLKVNPT